MLFDLPRWLCTWRVIVRYFKIRLGRQVWRLPRNCQAGPDWEPVRDFPTFLLYIWRFPTGSLPRAYDRLAEAGVERLVVLRSTGDTRALDASFTATADPSEVLRAHEEPLADAMAG